MAESAELLTPLERLFQYEPLTTLQGRLLLAGEALNPDKKDLPPVTPEQLSPEKKIEDRETVGILGRASTKERQRENGVSQDQLGSAIEQWSTETSKILRGGFKGKQGFDDEQATRWEETVKKILRVETPEGITQQKLTEIYNKYFTGDNRDSNIKQFIQDIVQVFGNDFTQIQTNLDAIQYLSGIFGADSSEVVAQLFDAHTRSQTNPDELVTKLNEGEDQGVSNINKPNEREEELLKFLWEEREPAVVKPEPTEPPVPPEPHPVVEQQQLEPGKDYSLTELFQHVQGDPVTTHRYFIEGQPQPLIIDQISLTPPFIPEKQQPFFLLTYTDEKKTTYQWQLNEQAAPYVYTLHKKGFPRFDNGESATDGDSGIFGLCASSAPTHETQAQLYKVMAESIVQIHQLNPSLFKSWFEAQLKPTPGTDLPSLSQFIMNDVDPQTDQLRPEKERLLIYTHEDGQTIDVDPDASFELWKKNIVELQQALEQGKLQKHHLRWIELLGHSINIDELMLKIKEGAKKPEDPMIRNIKSQEILIDTEQQQKVIQAFPEIFQQAPERYRFLLAHGDILMVLAGLKPGTEIIMAGDTYNPEEVEKLRQVLAPLGVRLEDNIITRKDAKGRLVHYVYLYNPSSLEQYTQAHHDLCPPYHSVQTLPEWLDAIRHIDEGQTEDNGLMGFYYGFPRSAIDNFRSRKPEDEDHIRNFGRYNETYFVVGEPKGDVLAREKAKDNFFQLTAASINLQGIENGDEYKASFNTWNELLPEEVRQKK